MAIYHLRAQVISRGDGRNAVNAAAYRRGATMRDEQTFETFSYAHKRDIAHSELAMPEAAPAWAQKLLLAHDKDPVAASAALWNRVEAHEKRGDAQLAHEIEIALPAELSLDDNIALVRAFVSEQLVSRNMAADWSIHLGKNDNVHAHIMLTMRPLSEDGFGAKKVAVLDETGVPKRDKSGRIQYHYGSAWGGKADLIQLREQWADYQNLHLARAGHGVRVDHRSHEAQGIDVTPTVHLGVQATHMEARGFAAERAAAFEEARAQGAREITERPERIFELLTHKKAVFTRRDMAREVNRYIDGADAFQAIMDRLEASPELVRLAPEDGRQPPRYSTRAMIADEAQMAQVAERLANAQSHGVAHDLAQAVLAHHLELSEEQRAAVLHITAEGRIAAIAGAAGSGKSTALKAAKEAFEAQGYRVRGAALAGKAAEGLEAGSGIPSRTIASLEWAWKEGRDALQSRDVLIIDEAGMAGSRQLLRVLAKVEQAGAKLVLVGDAEQLQPIEAGAPFRAIAERIGMAEISAIRRQSEGWAREASQHFAKGAVRDGLAAYRARGCVRLLEKRTEAKAALARDWLAGRQPSASSIILAHTREDVQDLNHAIRALRHAAFELGPEAAFQTEKGERRFAAGDRVVFLKNDRELGVKNGTLATVEAAGQGRLSVLLDGGERRQVDEATYCALDHGYAVTIHKAQGMTVDSAYVLASGGMDRHLAYVAMTRHRQAASLYAGGDDFKSYGAMAALLSRRRPKETTLDFAERRGIDSIRDWLENGRAAFATLAERFELAVSRLRERFGLPTVERAPQQSDGHGPERQAKPQAEPGARKPAAKRPDRTSREGGLEQAWQAAVANEFERIKVRFQQRAGTLEEHRRALLKELERQEEAKPVAPRGLSALKPGAKDDYAKRVHDWTKARALLSSRLQRTETLQKRARDYSEKGVLKDYPSKGEILARRMAERRHPELAQAIKLDQEQKRQRVSAELQRQLKQERDRGRGRGRSR